MILLDSDGNSQMDTQAQDRAHRISDLMKARVL